VFGGGVAACGAAGGGWTASRHERRDRQRRDQKDAWRTGGIVEQSTLE